MNTYRCVSKQRLLSHLYSALTQNRGEGVVMVNQISDEGYLSRPTIYPERSRGIGSGGTSLGSEEARQSLVTIHRSLALKYLPMNTKPPHLDMPLRLDINEQIECAYTLASRFYTDPTVLEIEKEK